MAKWRCWRLRRGNDDEMRFKRIKIEKPKANNMNTQFLLSIAKESKMRRASVKGKGNEKNK